MGAARGCVAPAAAGLLSDTVAMDKGRATRGLESSLGDNIASSVGWPDRYIGEYFLTLPPSVCENNDFMFLRKVDNTGSHPV